MKYLSKKFNYILARPLLLMAVTLVVASGVGFGVARVLSSRSIDSNNCKGLCVALTEEGVNPDTLAVKVGEFVQFNSRDGKKHNISMGKGSDGAESDDHESHSAPHEHVGDYSSGDFGADEAWRVQFKKAGTYRLHDHYNPKLEVVVVVYEPGSKNIIE